MSDIQKSSRRRFIGGGGNSRERNKKVSGSETVYEFGGGGFDSIETIDNDESTWAATESTSSKKSSIQKYSIDDNNQLFFSYGDASIHRSSSDFGIVSSTAVTIAGDTDDDQSRLDDPESIRDYSQLQHRLEMMHDRCIARNLRAAGLGGYESENDNTVYGVLNPNARMSTGEPMLIGAIIYVHDPDRQVRNLLSFLN